MQHFILRSSLLGPLSYFLQLQIPLCIACYYYKPLSFWLMFPCSCSMESNADTRSAHPHIRWEYLAWGEIFRFIQQKFSVITPSESATVSLNLDIDTSAVQSIGEEGVSGDAIQMSKVNHTDAESHRLILCMTNKLFKRSIKSGLATNTRTNLHCNKSLTGAKKANNLIEDDTLTNSTLSEHWKKKFWETCASYNKFDAFLEKFQLQGVTSRVTNTSGILLCSASQSNGAERLKHWFVRHILSDFYVNLYSENPTIKRCCTYHCWVLFAGLSRLSAQDLDDLRQALQLFELEVTSLLKQIVALNGAATNGVNNATSYGNDTAMGVGHHLHLAGMLSCFPAVEKQPKYQKLSLPQLEMVKSWFTAESSTSSNITRCFISPKYELFPFVTSTEDKPEIAGLGSMENYRHQNVPKGIVSINASGSKYPSHADVSDGFVLTEKKAELEKLCRDTSYSAVIDTFKAAVFNYFEFPELSASYNILTPPRILLYGNHGGSKVKLLLRLAKQCYPKISMVYANVSTLFSGYVGESEQKLKQLFLRAKECVPSLVVLEAIDHIASKSLRQGTNSSATPIVPILPDSTHLKSMEEFGERNGKSSTLSASKDPCSLCSQPGAVPYIPDRHQQKRNDTDTLHYMMLTTLLLCLDSVDGAANLPICMNQIGVVGTCSCSPHELDEAVVRAGRLEKWIYVPSIR